LKNSAIDLPGVPENLLNLLLVKNKFGYWLGCGSGIIWAGSLRQRNRIVDRLCHLDRNAVTGNMHVHNVRRFSNQVIVDRGFLYATLLKLRQDGFDLVLGENQVAHYHGFRCLPA
jgi:hypothetical protein